MAKRWYELLTFSTPRVADVVAEMERQQDEDDRALTEHVLTCRVDGFCYVCQCL